ncbi:hypothetical protein MYX07_02435 [Patescibacteria group bacterium AH-259-L07]|nr:hypothetical protein [Patescibacteria group bacterium AH-259-L07]
MNKKIKQCVIWTTVIIVVIGGIITLTLKGKQPGKLDEFAKCLKAKGAVFYGAFWCPHCQNQEQMFGASKKYLPYVECSTPDGRSQTFQCKSQNITGYPTWEFADESRLSGEISLKILAEKTDCTLPDNYY